MKKSFSLLFICLIISCFAYSKTLLEKQDKIYCYYTSEINDPDWEVKISCADDAGACINGICYIKEGREFTIHYNSADVGGILGRQGGRVSTVLRIKQAGNERELSAGETTIACKKGDFFLIELCTRSDESAFLESIYTIQIGAVEDIYDISTIPYLANYSGKICSYSGEIEFNGPTDKYSLTIECKNAYLFDSGKEFPEVYVAKGAPITINYDPASLVQSDHYYFTRYTNLKIEDFYTIPETVNKDMEIELYLIYNQQDGGTWCKARVSIKTDENSPTNPEVQGATNGWVNKPVTLTASGSRDNETGCYYEYKIGNGSWIRGNTCIVGEDEKIIDTTVTFRAVDYVGHVSEEVIVPVKIDKSKPEIKADKEAGKWTKEDITIEAIDTDSGVEKIIVTKDGKSYNSNVLMESGSYIVKAKDAAGNESSEKTYLIDKTKPEINLNGYESGRWTNKDVNIAVTDMHSLIQSVTKDNQPVSNYSNFTIGETGVFTISATDNAENENTVTVKIDKKAPEVTKPVFSCLGYEEKDGQKYLKTIGVKYTVTEEDSGIEKNQLYQNGIKIYESRDKEVTYKDTEYLMRHERDEDSEYKCCVKVLDNAGNNCEEKEASLIIPRKIKLEVVKEDDAGQGIRSSIQEGKYTVSGILINKIDFNLYKEIRLKRTFLGDREEGKTERNTFSFEDYKERFDRNTSETVIKENWEKAAQTIIKKTDVKEVSIGGKTYWYYEDRIETAGGLGHRGIRYQTEWDWKEIDVTEKGESVSRDKTANSRGKVKLRIKGTTENGSGVRYAVLDSEGNKIEEESDADFMIPVSGAVKLAVKIEDEDFDDYSIQMTELVQAKFKDSEGNYKKENLAVAIEGAEEEGYIEKREENGQLKSQFRSTEAGTDGWYEFENAEIKLYYNKPFNMKITMAEGCRGNNGAYKDLTESGIIRLKAGSPDLGGFKLITGEGAGYNEDGITARPYQEIGLSVEFNTEDGNENAETEWNFGDGEIQKTKEVVHKYRQAPERKGNTSEYKLKVRVSGGQGEKEAEVNVHIVDTQYGVLLGNEEWIGKHAVTGKIQVPENVSLTVLDNDEANSNPTEILCFGSLVEERKGQIEILNGGSLSIDCSKLKMTEGKNKEEFIRIKTAKEGGLDESFKWGGIVIRSGAGLVKIKGTEIEYAGIGINAEKGTDIQLENTTVRNCSEYALQSCGEIYGEGFEAEDCENGILIEKEGSLRTEGRVFVTGSSKAIECRGTLKASAIDLEDIKERGILVEGKLETENGISIKGSGKVGFESTEGAVVDCTGKICVRGFEKGIKNSGRITSGKEVEVTESKDYGIRNEGNISAEGLKIISQSGRGYVCGSGSNAKFKETQIEAGEIGIHCSGTALADFGKSVVRAVTYGVKTDRDGNGVPSVKLKEGSLIEGAAVLWYDWENGVLSKEEIEEQFYAN